MLPHLLSHLPPREDTCCPTVKSKPETPEREHSLAFLLFLELGVGCSAWTLTCVRENLRDLLGLCCSPGATLSLSSLASEKSNPGQASFSGSKFLQQEWGRFFYFRREQKA